MPRCWVNSLFHHVVMFLISKKFPNTISQKNSNWKHLLKGWAGNNSPQSILLVLCFAAVADNTKVFSLLLNKNPGCLFKILCPKSKLRGEQDLGKENSWASWPRLSKGVFHDFWYQIRYRNEVKEGSGESHPWCLFS